jgi:hypothetical protein
MGNEFGHPEWIDFPRDDSYDPSTGAFVPGGFLQTYRSISYFINVYASAAAAHACLLPHMHQADHAINTCALLILQPASHLLSSAGRQRRQS